MSRPWGRRSRTPLFVRGVRARPAAAFALTVLVASALTASVLGPLLVRALGQSAVRSAVAAAPAVDRSVRVSTYLGTADQTGAGVQAVRTVFTTAYPAAEEGGAPPGGDRAAHPRPWRPLVLSAQSESNLRWSAGSTRALSASRVSSTVGGCRAFAVVRGRCPERAGEVLISTRDAAAHRLGDVGRSVVTVVLPDTSTVHWTVVGTYDLGRTAPEVVTPAGTPQTTYAAVTGDSLVVSPDQLERLAVAVTVVGSVRTTGLLGLDDADGVRTLVARLRSAALDQQRQLLVDSPLLRILDDSARQTQDAGVLVTVTSLQAFLLALLASAAVMSRIARSRAPEWAVGRLRGLSWRRWSAAVFPETLAPVVLGLLLGAVTVLAVSQWVVRATLARGVEVEPWRPPVLLAAGACAVGSVLALAAASLPSLRRSLAEQLRERSESSVDGPVVVAVQVLVVTVAALAVYQLVAGGVLSGSGPQLGLAAPAVLAVALAVVATRVAVQLVRWATARPPRGLAALVVGRHAARAPSTLVPAVVVAVGVALAVFATQVPVLSQRNQSLRADATVGAATVLHVRVPAGASLVDLVRAADPAGRSAMAVRERAASADGSTSRIVAVDSTRLASVSAWRTQWAGVPDPAAAVAGMPGSPVTLRGTRLDLTVAGANVVAAVSGASVTEPHPNLSLVLESRQRWQTVALGPLDRPGGRFTARLPCRDGCRLVNLTVTGDAQTAYTASFVVTGLEMDGQTPPNVRTALHGAPWHPRVGNLTDPTPATRLSASASSTGLEVQVSDDVGDLPVVLLPPDAVDPLPAVVGPRTETQRFPGIPDAVSGTGLDGQSQLLALRGRSSVLPRALGDGVLVDLVRASALVDPSADQAEPEVWLAAGASPAVVDRLVRAGVVVEGRELLATERDRLLQEPAPLAARLGAAMAVVALVLALLTVVAGRAADGPRRQADWAALRAAGLSGVRLRRLARLEIALPPVLGALLGAVAGWVAVSLAASRLPLVDLAVAGPPLDLGLSWMPVLEVFGTAVAVLVLVACVGALTETRDRAGRR